MEFQFTTRSQEAVTAAAQRAAELGNPQINSLHLLWVLAEQKDGIARALLQEVGADPSEVARRAEEQIRTLPHVSGPGASGHPTFVGSGFDALEAARREADSHSRTYLSTEHLLIGIALGKDPAARLLASLGAKPAALRDALSRLTSGADSMSASDNPDPESTFQSLQKYGVDLTEQAQEGRLDPVIGREIGRAHV